MTEGKKDAKISFSDQTSYLQSVSSSSSLSKRTGAGFVKLSISANNEFFFDILFAAKFCFLSRKFILTENRSKKFPIFEEKQDSKIVRLELKKKLYYSNLASTTTQSKKFTEIKKNAYHYEFFYVLPT